MRKLITLLALLPSLAGGPVLAQCELHPSGSIGGSQPGEGFGSAVAVSGSTLIVGARLYDCSPTTQDCGAVYGPGWFSVGPNAEDYFGTSVAASGEIAIVGAPGDNYCQPSGGDCGRAYVFRNGVREATLGGRPAFVIQAFGYAVSAGPDVVAAGAPFDLCSPHTPFCGTVAIYRYSSGSQSWTYEAKIQPSDLLEDGEFGTSLSLDGNVLAVGARYGRAFVFRFNGTSWIEEKRLAIPNYYYYVGTAVAVEGDVLVVGVGGTSYVFRHAATDWQQEAELPFGGGLSMGGGLIGVAGRVYKFDGQGWAVRASLVSGGVSAISEDHVVYSASGGRVYSFVLNDADCNANGATDDCDIADDTGRDCNSNGVPDECDIAECVGDPACTDCNSNGLPDGCDIADDTSRDCNSNGVPDECESDEDSDSVIDACDSCPDTFFGLIVDSDGCPIPIGPCCFPGDFCINSADSHDCGLAGGDYVGDGLTCTGDPDGDGVSGCADLCPIDPLKTDPQRCGCGVAETDSDFDQIPDCVDGCPDDDEKTEPGACGCGVPDIDTDGDGALDCVDPCPFDDPDDTDGDGVCDHADRCPLDFADDPDGDGACDSDDGCPSDPDKVSPGECGCGFVDGDSDDDAVADCNDLCPGSLLTQPINMCGCPEQGACCFTVGVCFENMRFENCDAIGGTYQGDGSACSENCPLPDFDGNGVVNLLDWLAIEECWSGPSSTRLPKSCAIMDADGCGSIDLRDYSIFIQSFGNQPEP